MESSDETHRARRSRALVGLASAVAALVLAEVTLRALALPPVGRSVPGGENAESVLVADPDLFWLLDPDGDRYQVNAHGLRGPWPRTDRHPNELRIACIGDSCTFGTGVRIDQTYGHTLERELQARLPERCVSTTLLALPGYSTFQDRLLVERYGADIDPDIAVLYCGAWNDHAPARGLRDSQREGASPLRLARLVNLAFDGTTYAAEGRDGSRADVPLDERRVAPEEFRDNLRAMITRLRDTGSRVVVVLPPAPSGTLRRNPASGTYRRIVRELADEHDVAFVDGQGLFESFLETVPPDWREDETGRSLLFRDWIHPAPLGHELLARAILEVLRPELARWQDGTEGVAEPRLGEPVPRELPHGRTTTVAIPRLDSIGIERVWLGERVVSRFESDRDRLRLVVSEDLPPGDYPIRVATEGGWFETGREITIQAPQIRVSLARAGASAELEADVPGPPGAAVILWMSLERSEPLATRYGPLHLRFDEGGRPPGRTDLPLNFRRLSLPSFRARVGEDGVARIRETFAVSDGRRTEAVHFQALVGGWEKPGFLTRVVRVSVPR